MLSWKSAARCEPFPCITVSSIIAAVVPVEPRPASAATSPHNLLAQTAVSFSLQPTAMTHERLWLPAHVGNSEMFARIGVCACNMHCQLDCDFLIGGQQSSQERSEEKAASRPSSPEVESLEAQLAQLQSRLLYMEDEKARLVTAAGKNEQVHMIPFCAEVMYG